MGKKQPPVKYNEQGVPLIAPEAKKDADKYKVTKDEINAWLTKRRLPLNKVSLRRKARSAIRKRKEKQSLPKGKDVSFTQTDAPMQIIYGTVRVGGVFSLIHLTRRNRWLNTIITVAGHEVESIEGVYLDDQWVEFTGNWAINTFAPNGDSKVFLDKNLGSDSQAALASAIAEMPSFWTSDHRQRNRAHAYLTLIYAAALFSEGMPEVNFKIKGRKCYDPRTATVVWTDNPALCIANYLVDPIYGMGIVYTDIDETALIAAANACDEAVPLAAGGTEKRYTLNGSFYTDQTPREVLETMLSAMGGYLIMANGKWRILAATYRTPTVTLTEDDLRSTPTIQTLISKKDIFNGVRGSYLSTENYETTDFPTIKNAAYATQDGEEILEDISLPYTTSSSMAQRLAKIELERIRRQITLTAEWGLKAYQVNIGDNVMITLPRYGFSSKVFEVVDYNFYMTQDMQLTVQLQLRETDSGVYSWDETQDEQTITAAPRTTLPDPNQVEDPTGLTLTSGTNELYTRSDGTIFSRIKVAWTSPDDVFVTESGKIQLQHKRTSDSVWSAIAEVDGDIDFFHILDVADGQSYDVRIRSKNGVGNTGNFVQATHVVVGKTAAPSAPSAFSSNFQEYAVALSWSSISDLDIAYYELRRGGANWAAGTFVAEVRGTNFIDKFQTAGAITYRLKAVDTSGNYSAEVTTPVTITGPGAVTGFNIRTIDNNVLLDWEEGTAGAFPVAKYKIYKGATFGAAELLGTVEGTFHMYLETVGGSYTYWVVAVDTAGNESTEEGKNTVVLDPPDYILYDDFTPEVGDGTFTNAREHDDINYPNSILACVNTSESWEDHFINNGWANIQAQITAGYPIYIQPTEATGSWELEIDYGADIPACLVKLSHTKIAVAGTVTVTPKIYVKLLAGDSWTLYNADQAFVIPFRYLKGRLEFAGSADTALAIIKDINIKLDVKKQTDGGSGLSSSSSTVIIPFNEDFIDVRNIVISAASTSGEKLYAVPVYDWANPDTDEFGVLIYNQAGTQVAARFSWTAEGVIRPQ